jgi:hypothetical protein
MRFSLRFLEVSVNRDDFGPRWLQFKAPGRNIERVSPRANDHDQPVSCDEKWIFSNKEKRRFFSHVPHLPQNARPFIDRFELWSIRRWIFPRFKLSFVKAIAFSTAERYAPIACDSRSVEAMSGRPALMMLRRTIRSSPDICCRAIRLTACSGVGKGFTVHNMASSFSIRPWICRILFPATRRFRGVPDC